MKEEQLQELKTLIDLCEYDDTYYEPLSVVSPPWTLLFAEKEAVLWDLYPWTIHERKGKVYITHPVRIRGKVIMMSLLRLLAGLQDFLTGESLSPNVVTLRHDPYDGVIDLRPSNRLVCPKSVSNMRKRKERHGILRTKGGSYVGYLYCSKRKNPIYFGTHRTMADAIAARNSILEAEGCSTICSPYDASYSMENSSL